MDIFLTCFISFFSTEKEVSFVICANKYWHRPLVLSFWCCIDYHFQPVINNISASDRELIPHDFWISGERQRLLDSLYEVSWHGEIMPTIELATFGLHIRCGIPFYFIMETYYNVLVSEIMEAYNKTENPITESKIMTKEQSPCAI